MTIREQIDDIIGNMMEAQGVEDNVNLKKNDLFLELGSFQFIGFVVQLENHFDIEFEDEMLGLGSFNSIDDICDYIQSRKEQDE